MDNKCIVIIIYSPFNPPIGDSKKIKMPYKDADIRRRKARERMKKWRSNPANSEKKKAYYKKNKDKISQKSKEYYIKNREHILNRTSVYNKQNSGVVKKAQKKRRILVKEYRKVKKKEKI